MPRAAVLLALLTSSLAALGCGRTVAVDHWIPPQADVGGARTLAITDAYGRDASVAAVQDAALDVAGDARWFEHVHTTARLETDGVDVWLRDGGALMPGVLYARIDVLEDDAVVHTVEDANGVHETVTARTVVTLTLADIDGLLVDELELEGVHERGGPLTPFDVEQALEQSALAAARGALAVLTPQPASTSVPLDDRDGDVNALLDQHFARDRDDAERLTRGEVAKRLAKLDSAPALWNRAALLESDGARDDALGMYEAAVAHADAADFYDEHYAQALDRAAADDALGL